MTNLRSLAEAIQTHYGFVKKPSDEEVKKILSCISIRKASGKSVDEAELQKIIVVCLKDATVINLESVDMSPTINILRQILNAAEQQQSK